MLQRFTHRLWSTLSRSRAPVPVEVPVPPPAVPVNPPEATVTEEDTSRDAIFLWVPKTAGTSLHSILTANKVQQYYDVESIGKSFRNKGTAIFGHLGLNQLLKAGLVTEEYARRAWKFAFVRNPFDRAVSIFEYLRLTTKDFPEPTTFSIFCRYLADGAFKPVGLYNHEGLNHMNPQAAWLLDDNQTLWPDFIGRVESYDEGVQTVLNELNIPQLPTGVPKLNTSSRKETASYYGKDEIAIVQKAYRLDFDLFGYSDKPYW